jgi:hypothetical protein
MVTGTGERSELARIVADGCGAADLVGDSIAFAIGEATGDPLGRGEFPHLRRLVSLVVRVWGVP